MNSRKAVRQAVLALVALGAGFAFAHPNHAEPGTATTILHLLTEPDHLLAILAAVGVGIWAVRRGSADKQRRD